MRRRCDVPDCSGWWRLRSLLAGCESSPWGVADVNLCRAHWLQHLAAMPVDVRRDHLYVLAPVELVCAEADVPVLA